MDDSDPNSGQVAVDISNLVTAIQLGNRNTAAIVQQLATRFGSEAATSTVLATSYHASGGVLVKSGAGYLVNISVTSASTGAAGLCYDSASVENSGASNAFALIPSSGFMTINWPFANGLVVNPSSQGTHIVSVAYV